MLSTLIVFDCDFETSVQLIVATIFAIVHLSILACMTGSKRAHLGWFIVANVVCLAAWGRKGLNTEGERDGDGNKPHQVRSRDGI